MYTLQKGDTVHASIVESMPQDLKRLLEEQTVANITKVRTTLNCVTASGLGAPGVTAPGLGAPGVTAPGLGAPGVTAPGLGAP
jgi:hypothetical protein